MKRRANMVSSFAAGVLLLALAPSAMAQSPTVTRIIASPSLSHVGQSVTLSSAVDALGGGAPTGNIAFTDGEAPLGAAPLSAIGAGQDTLAGGGAHSCALDAGGGASCWGDNSHGQIGDGTLIDRFTPTPVAGLSSGVLAVTAGQYHSCALTGAGAVMCWGENADGQLGDGTTTDRPTPVNVVGLTSGVVALAGGVAHTCALTASGAVKCWGGNFYGQLGDGTTINRSTPVNVVGMTKGIGALVAGGDHNCALNRNGFLRCWGYNVVGQIGDGTTVNRTTPVLVEGLGSAVVTATAGGLHSCAVTVAGGAKCWGWNFYGQIGDGTTTNRLKATAVAGLSTGLSRIIGGEAHSCAMTTAGAVKCWGLNSSGQLGDGTTTQRWTPVQVSGLTSGVVAITAGFLHSCATMRTGALGCWGDNSNGQIGDGTVTQRLVPTLVSGGQKLVRARAQLSTTALKQLGLRILWASFPGSQGLAPSVGSTKHRVIQ